MFMAHQTITTENAQAIDRKGINTFSCLSIGLFIVATLLHIFRLLAG
jgi:hypothetical protein